MLRRSGSASAILVASSLEAVTVSNLAFDLDAGSLSSAVAISATGPAGVGGAMLRVERCTFYTSTIAT